MSMILDIIRGIIKNRPLTVVLLLFLIGFVLGWLLIGWGIWPVKWEGESYPNELWQEDKEEFLTMVADSYALNKDMARAKARLNRLGIPEEVNAMMAVLVNDYNKAGRTTEADRLNKLSEALAKEPEMVAPPTAVPGATAPPLVVKKPSLVSGLLPICGGLILVILVIAGAGLAFSIVRRRREAEVGVPTMPEARRPAAYWEGVEQPPLGNFITTYALGDDNYDESFSIETPLGEFLGECGVGISETIGTGTPDKVTAFEIWLFDKSDIRTVTKVLMSEHAYHDDALRAKLASKGDPVLATPGQEITLETASLQVKAEVTGMTYGSGDLPPQSHFAKLTVELVAMAKGPGEAENVALG